MHSRDLIPPDKFSNLIIWCQELKIFNKKVKVLFNFFSFFWIKAQLSHLTSQVIDMVWSLFNIHIVKPNLDWRIISYFVSYLSWFFFKSILKAVFDAFYLIPMELYSWGFMVINFKRFLGLNILLSPHFQSCASLFILYH